MSFYWLLQDKQDNYFEFKDIWKLSVSQDFHLIFEMSESPCLMYPFSKLIIMLTIITKTYINDKMKIKITLKCKLVTKQKFSFLFEPAAFFSWKTANEADSKRYIIWMDSTMSVFVWNAKKCINDGTYPQVSWYWEALYNFYRCKQIWVGWRLYMNTFCATWENQWINLENSARNVPNVLWLNIKCTNWRTHVMDKMYSLKDG